MKCRPNRVASIAAMWNEVIFSLLNRPTVGPYAIDATPWVVASDLYLLICLSYVFQLIVNIQTFSFYYRYHTFLSLPIKLYSDHLSSWTHIAASCSVSSHLHICFLPQVACLGDTIRPLSGSVSLASPAMWQRGTCLTRRLIAQVFYYTSIPYAATVPQS